ncbi:MAG TPA: FAD-dependent oxidoreductase, partial [Pirellulaceae bacterium]|nr:FAD-dependent oxidoreductase [Pirellulaceae bacterium]
MAEPALDVVVLGGGPGGYVAAIRAAQLGLRAAVIDEHPKFGGTCLRVGCIPSKALLESSHLLYETLNHLGGHGIVASQVSLDLSAMMRRKDKIVDTLTGGINMLLKKNRVQTIVGRGMLTGNRTIRVAGQQPTEIEARYIILAPGSIPMVLPNIDYDGDRIGDSTAALSYPEVPKQLVVIGGGYIGLELGSVWSRLGAEVVVLEALDRILAGVDGEIAKHAHRIFQNQGLVFRTNTRVERVRKTGDRCVVEILDGAPITCDRVLVCAGRVPNTRNIGLESLSINTDRRGHIVVDQHFQTNVPGVFAIGDAIGGAMLAHKASEEGMACVEWIATGYGH